MIEAKCRLRGKKALFIDPSHPCDNEYTLCGNCVRVERLFQPKLGADSEIGDEKAKASDKDS